MRPLQFWRKMVMFVSFLSNMKLVRRHCTNAPMKGLQLLVCYTKETISGVLYLSMKTWHMTHGIGAFSTGDFTNIINLYIGVFIWNNFFTHPVLHFSTKIYKHIAIAQDISSAHLIYLIITYTQKQRLHFNRELTRTTIESNIAY